MEALVKYRVRVSNQFKKQYKICIRRGLDVELIDTAMRILSEKGKLPQVYRPHKLKGKHKDIWECHIEPDWLMIWEQNDTELTLLFLETGTHADLFNK